MDIISITSTNEITVLITQSIHLIHLGTPQYLRPSLSTDTTMIPPINAKLIKKPVTLVPYATLAAYLRYFYSSKLSSYVPGHRDFLVFCNLSFPWYSTIKQRSTIEASC